MSKTAKYTIILMVATVMAKALGFVREICLAYVYGAGAISDAYIVAYSIPTILFAGLGTAILTCYIPMYTEIQEHRPNQINKFNNNVMTMVFLLSLVVLSLFWIFDKSIVRLFAIGFEGPTFDLAAKLAKIMMVSVLFIGISNILQGFLQIKGSFFIVGIVSVPLNVFVIGSILLSNKGNDTVLALGPVLGYAATMVMLFVAAAGKGFSYRPHLNLKDPNIIKIIYLVLPIFMGRMVMQINNMIDRTLASTLPVGSVSSLNYASRIYGFVISVFVISLTTAIFPKLAKQNSRKSSDNFKNTTMSSVRMATLFVLPISAGSIVLAEPVVRLLFGRGAFTEESIIMTSQALIYYSLGLLFFSVKEILNNVFYSMQNTRIPTINSVATVLLNITFNLLLIGPMGYKGLALGTSLASAITTVTIMISLRKKLGPLGLKGYTISFVKMLFATFLMGYVAKVVYDFVALRVSDSIGLVLSLGSAALAGALVYFVILIILRTREVGELVVGAVDMVKGRRKRS